MNKIDTFFRDFVFRGEEIAPVLFVGQNLEKLHERLLMHIQELLEKHGIDTQSLFHLESSKEALKIEMVKNFVSAGNQKARFAFQVFFIEDMSRMTTQAQNSCLKFFEEPGVGNIIFITTQSESAILDTLLSRMNIIRDTGEVSDASSQVYKDMIHNCYTGSSDELIEFFAGGKKRDNQEYIIFLNSLRSYIFEKKVLVHLLENIQRDITGIEKNNFSPRGVVDGYILKILESRLENI